MKVNESERYLGDFLGSSLSESVLKTIQNRKGLTMRLINEIKVTVEDYKANSVGGLTLGLKIWNQAVCPFLYGNSSCWIQIPKKALTLLNSIQRDFFRSLFLQPKGCPIPLFLYDTGSLSPEIISSCRNSFFSFISVTSQIRLWQSRSICFKSNSISMKP